MMDVSDGLLLDVRRIAEASRCAAIIDLDSLPLSDAFKSIRGDSLDARLFAATGGDDYALVATLPSDLTEKNIRLFAREVLPALQTLTDKEYAGLQTQAAE